MGSTVKSRPNHYEVLGLTPAASSEEIAQAFAEQLDPLRPRAFGSLAEVTIAFETLRDRARREAYDIAFGLKPKPTPPSPEVPAEWAPFLIRASARPVARPLNEYNIEIGGGLGALPSGGVSRAGGAARRRSSAGASCLVGSQPASRTGCRTGNFAFRGRKTRADQAANSRIASGRRADGRRAAPAGRNGSACV